MGSVRGYRGRLGARFGLRGWLRRYWFWFRELCERLRRLRFGNLCGWLRRLGLWLRELCRRLRRLRFGLRFVDLRRFRQLRLRLDDRIGGLRRLDSQFCLGRFGRHAKRIAGCRGLFGRQCWRRRRDISGRRPGDFRTGRRRLLRRLRLLHRHLDGAILDVAAVNR